MAKILVVSDHQDLKQSHSNRLILDDLERHFGADIEVRRLSELYPDFHIDVAAEQYVVVVGIFAIGNQQAGADFVVQVLPFDVPAAERGVFFGEHVGDFANAGGLVAAAVGIDEGFQVFQKGFFFHDFAPKR